jgi:hypothetical protein
LDPLLAIALTASVIAFASLGAYVIRQPASEGAQNYPHSPDEPDIALIPPSTRHEVIWNPKLSYMLFSGPEGKVSKSTSYTPIFTVKTTNNAYVQDATVKWQIEMFGIAKLVKDSKNLSEYEIETANDSITIMGGPNRLIPFTYRDQDMASSQDLPIAFITNAGANAFIPNNVYTNAALYILALMPNAAGARINPFTFLVSVSWNLPNPGTRKFLIKASIVNAKPPDVDEPKVDALMSFEVAKVQ